MKKKRIRGVVAHWWYHRADKSATATRDPAPSPAGCGSDIPKLSAQRPAVSVSRPLILHQALGKPLLIYLQRTFRQRGMKRERTRGREWMQIIKKERARDKRQKEIRAKTQTGGYSIKNIPLILSSRSLSGVFSLSP